MLKVLYTHTITSAGSSCIWITLHTLEVFLEKSSNIHLLDKPFQRSEVERNRDKHAQNTNLNKTPEV